jgi:1,2-phenylacetyl-CoA epoxidase PaaB subunit
MWVVPVKAIFSRTAEEILAQQIQPLGETQPANETFYIFSKTRSSGTQTLLGSLRADSPLQALRLALTTFSSQKTVFAWWVVQADQLTRSGPEDIESMYAPARDKGFRLSTDFHTLSAMREIKKP